jgi:2-polyprenyl-3-methyl-5-hydroxy-6-metoxy-1,4-benzoquinol methylase
MTDLQISKHFDRLAPLYDSYKQKNPYYYQTLKHALQKIIPAGKKILDFGCGTGEILSYLRPSYGLGIDVSQKMITIAGKKFSENRRLHFQTDLKKVRIFDTIILVDVMEHLSHPGKTLKQLQKHADDRTQLIVTFIDSFWEPLLHLLETLRLKMPEGPHNRLSRTEVITIASQNGFFLKDKQYVPLFPSIFSPVLPVTILVFQRHRDKIPDRRKE